MGKQIPCRTCGRPFVPGKTGAAGLCQAHYRRAVRGSRNADDPRRLRDGTRPCRVGGYVSRDVSDRVTRIAFKLGKPVSEWVAETIERALSSDEKKAGLK